MKNGLKNSCPKELPIIGSGLNFGKDPLRFFDELNFNHGDIVPYSILGTPFVAVYHPEHIEHVLTKNASNYSKSIYIKEKWNAFLGQGLISADGAIWKNSRRLMQPLMSRDKFGKYFETVLNETLSSVNSIHDGEVTDVHRFTMKSMLFTFVKILFNSKLKEEEIERIGTLFAECISYFNYTLTPPGVLLEKFPTPQKARYKKAIEELDFFVYNLIDAPDTSDGMNMLSILKNARDENGTPLAKELVRDQILTFFLAGHETSALTVNYVLFSLAKHPEELKKIQDEIDSCFGDELPTFEKLDSLKHLKNVINEAFRLYPPVSVIGREALSDDKFGDFVIKKGTNISIPVTSIHHDKRWYTSPESFIPSRWNDPELASQKGIFLPFGSGPRLCIGAGFSLMKISTFLIVLLQRYEIKLRSSSELEFIVSLTTRPKENILLEFNLRKAKDLRKSA